MAYLSGVAAAAARGQVVRAAVLAFLDFRDGPGRYWLGFGPLRTADGQTWEGTGNLASISDLLCPAGTTSSQITLALSGVNARTAALARSQSAQVKGRDAFVYVQFFTDDAGLLDAPVVVWAGLLDVMTYAVGEDGRYTVSVTAENPWSGRNRPPYGYLNDTDQQARHPGDRGLELVASLPGKAINWPS